MARAKEATRVPTSGIEGKAMIGIGTTARADGINTKDAGVEIPVHTAEAKAKGISAGATAEVGARVFAVAVGMVARSMAAAGVSAQGRGG